MLCQRFVIHCFHSSNSSPISYICWTKYWLCCLCNSHLSPYVVANTCTFYLIFLAESLIHSGLKMHQGYIRSIWECQKFRNFSAGSVQSAKLFFTMRPINKGHKEKENVLNSMHKMTPYHFLYTNTDSVNDFLYTYPHLCQTSMVKNLLLAPKSIS